MPSNRVVSQVASALEALDQLLTLSDQRVTTERCSDLLQSLFHHLHLLNSQPNLADTRLDTCLRTEIEWLLEAQALMCLRIMEQPEIQISESEADFKHWRERLQMLHTALQTNEPSR